jgi:hypothetical protein
MSATSARVDGPGTAEIAPIRAEVVTDVASGDATDGSVPAENADDVAEGVEAAQAVEAGTVDTEEAEHRHKALTVARIRMSKAPAAVKERFVELAEAANQAATVEACLKAVEETLPEFLSANDQLSGLTPTARQGEHPAGDVFFRGNAEEISDEQAEEVARRQLERSGLLRGQRVRVGD